MHEQVEGEPLSENPALDSWQWILRARAAARQAVEGVAPPAMPSPDVDKERQGSAPE